MTDPDQEVPVPDVGPFCVVDQELGFLVHAQVTGPNYGPFCYPHYLQWAGLDEESANP